MTSNIDFSSVIAQAVQAEVAKMLTGQATPAAQNPAPAAAAAAAAKSPVVSTTEGGKLRIQRPQSAKPNTREDLRVPETILVIGKDEAGNDITLGWNSKFGFGVQFTAKGKDGKPYTSMVWHHASLWKALAGIAPVVHAAITQNYEIA